MTVGVVGNATAEAIPALLFLLVQMVMYDNGTLTKLRQALEGGHSENSSSIL